MNDDLNLLSNESPPWHYDIVARSLHWILAVLLVGMLLLGWYMMSIEREPGSGWYFSLHKSFGLLAAALILLRLIWRATHTPAPLPKSIPLWQVTLAHISHWLLYLCIILMPLTGFIGASYSKHGVAFFGLPMPKWVEQNHAISQPLFNIHGIIAWVLVTLISLHVLAALKHFLINRDTVFQRML